MFLENSVLLSETLNQFYLKTTVYDLSFLPIDPLASPVNDQSLLLNCSFNIILSFTCLEVKCV